MKGPYRRLEKGHIVERRHIWKSHTIDVDFAISSRFSLHYYTIDDMTVDDVTIHRKRLPINVDTSVLFLSLILLIIVLMCFLF